MKNELSEFDDSFIKINIILAYLGSILTIIPTFILLGICFFIAHGFKFGGYHPEAYLYLLIPVGFYLLWIFTLIAVVNANLNKAISTIESVLFFSNIILTVPLIIFYLTIFLKLKFGL